MNSNFYEEAIILVRSLLFLSLVCFSVVPTVIQSQVFPVKNYDASKGLMSNNVSDLYQDAKGYLWMVTPEGISKFNGTEFVNFPFSEESRGEYITSIVESKKYPGRIYLATLGDGILKFERNIYSKVFSDPKVDGNSIECLINYDDSTFLFTNGKGIFLFNETTAKRLIDKKDISKLLIDKSGNLWMANDISLFVKLKNKNEIKELDLHGARISNDNSITELSTGELTYATQQKNILFFKNFKLSKTLEFPHVVTFINENNEKQIWIGTTDGLYKAPVDVKTLKNIPKFNLENEIQGVTFSDALIDKENNNWISTYGQGILKYENTHIFSFKFEGMVGLVSVDEKNNYWIPTRNGIWVIRQNEKEKWEKKFYDKKLITKKDDIFSLQITSDDHLWVKLVHDEARQFKVVYKDDFPQTILFEKDFPGANKTVRMSTQTLCIKDLMYYTTKEGGLEIVDIKNNPLIIKTFSETEIAPLVHARIAFIDREGFLWVCGIGNGILKLKKNNIGYAIEKKYRSLPFLDYDGLRAIAQTDDGKMWFGSRYNGLYCLDNDKFIRYTVKDGLLSNQITSLSVDDKKRIWVGTISGTCYIDYEDSLTFGINKDITQFPVFSCGTDQNNLFWAGTNFGISFLDRSTENRTLPESGLYFNSFLVNGEEKPISDGIELNYSERNCMFDFEAVTFNSKSDNLYQYFLQGFEKGWQKPVTNHAVTYADLSPGTYTFYVRMLNENKKPCSTVLHLTFTIIKPVWLRWWFITSALLLIFLTVAFFEKLRVSHLLKIEKIRSRIASDLHDDIGSGLTRIAMMSEMVNHLVKNKNDQIKTEGEKESSNNITLVGTTEKIGTTARELIESMSDVVWAVDPRNDSFDKLISRIKTYANEICDAQNISLHFEVLGNDSSVNPGSDILRCLLLVSKESLTNIIKHAACKKISVTFKLKKNEITFSIADNGKGFDPKELSRINGLNNMRARVLKAGGIFDIISVKEEGTKIIATVPLL